ncbi:aspartyl-phosphate phosphatase Spo0E family protein [Sporolactobacillus sp. THM7-4]|nr:aspartyl-phosphate phosphatase Spo0E family protein [Sporolactobacillus sp. THM7-4]
MSRLSIGDRALVHSEQIEVKRKQLFQTAEIYGLYAAETIKCSQELDRLIVEVQKKYMPAGVDSCNHAHP